MKNKLFRGIALSIVFILIALNIGTIRVLAAPDEEAKEETSEDKLIANPEDSYEVIHISFHLFLLSSYNTSLELSQLIIVLPLCFLKFHIKEYQL